MSKIEWLHMPGYKPQVWNPVTGCSKVSPGCKNCYAIPMSRRLSGIAVSKDKYSETTKGDNWTGEVFVHTEELEKPRSWKKPRMVFVNSMADLFQPKVPYHFQADVFQTMYRNQDHIYLILTKHAERMNVIVNRICENNLWGVHLPNVWLGVSVENQQYANERIPYLLNTLAAVRFLSCEPLLGPVDLQKIVVDNFTDGRSIFLKSLYRENPTNFPFIDWVIAGGESGHGARPMHPDWIRSLRDQCAAAKSPLEGGAQRAGGVPFFFKQWGEYAPVEVNTQNLEPLYHKKELTHWQNKEGQKFELLMEDGEFLVCGDQEDINECIPIKRLGKHHSGNTLDGKQHLEWPKTIRKEAIL